MQKENKKGRFWLRTSLVMAFVLIAQLFLPWWGMVLASCLAGYFTASLGKFAFLSGFTGTFLVWGLFAFYLDTQNDAILSTKVIHLLTLPEIPLLLVLISAILGGVLGGLSCKTGDLFRRFFMKEVARYY